MKSFYNRIPWKKKLIILFNNIRKQKKIIINNKLLLLENIIGKIKNIFYKLHYVLLIEIKRPNFYFVQKILIKNKN